MTLQEYYLDIVPGGVPVMCHASQYDTGRTLRFHIHKNGVPVVLAGGDGVQVTGTKPDRFGFAYDVEVTIGNDYVDVPITEQMCAVDGITRCQLVITNTAGVVGSAVFNLAVQKAALGNDTVVSDSDIPAIRDAQRYAAEAKEAAESIDVDTLATKEELNAKADAVDVEQLKSDVFKTGLEKQKRVVFIGDSFLNANPHNWGDRVAEYMGWTEYGKYAHPSAGFYTKVNGVNFDDAVKAGGDVYQGEYAHRNDVSLVICIGGINDNKTGGLTVEEMETAVTTFISDTKTLFPNAKLVLGINWGARCYPLFQSNGIKNACAKARDVMFIDGSHTWLLNYPERFYDGTHPDADGNYMASRILAQWLRTGTSYTPQKKNTQSDNGLTLTWWFDNQNLNFTLRGTMEASTGYLMHDLKANFIPYALTYFVPAYAYIGTPNMHMLAIDGPNRNIKSTGGMSAGLVCTCYASISIDMIR